MTPRRPLFCTDMKTIGLLIICIGVAFVAIAFAIAAVLAFVTAFGHVMNWACGPKDQQEVA